LPGLRAGAGEVMVDRQRQMEDAMGRWCQEGYQCMVAVMDDGDDRALTRCLSTLPQPIVVDLCLRLSRVMAAMPPWWAGAKGGALAVKGGGGTDEMAREVGEALGGDVVMAVGVATGHQSVYIRGSVMEVVYLAMRTVISMERSMAEARRGGEGPPTGPGPIGHYSLN